MFTFQIVLLLHLLAFLGLVLWNLREYAPLPQGVAPLNPEERLFVLIPARNEAENIAACLEGLLAQEWRAFTLLALDDGSEDGTDAIIAQIAAQDSRVELLRGEPIEPGWAGKVWACRRLGAAALERGADWLLFLDADTRAKPALIGSALWFAQTHRADMVSAFPYQVTGTFWERVALPMLHFLITTFLPIGFIWRLPFPGLVAACGQFELFSAAAYRKTGGHGSVPKSFHDGLQLARRVKKTGGTVRLFDGCGLITCRMYAGGRAVWNGFTRNAYEGLGGFVPLVAMTALQGLLFLAPFGFLLVALSLWASRGAFPLWGAVCAVQVAVIYLIRLLQARRFGHADSVWLHPLSVALMIAIQWASFWKSVRKTQVAWKGRTYG